MSTLRCMFCRGTSVSRSRRRPIERWLSWFGIYPFRCDHCHARFLALRPGASTT